MNKSDPNYKMRLCFIPVDNSKEPLDENISLLRNMIVAKIRQDIVDGQVIPPPPTSLLAVARSHSVVHHFKPNYSHHFGRGPNTTPYSRTRRTSKSRSR